MNKNFSFIDERANHLAMHEQTNFQIPTEYEPSKETKILGLSTMKKSLHIEGLEMPGLYQVYMWPMTIVAFIIMLALEIFTAGISYNEADVDPFVLLGTLLADFLLAFLLHRKKATELRIKNELILAKGVEEDQKEILLKKCRRWSSIFAILIILSGIFKLIFFQDAWGAFDATSWAVMFGIVICILIHIFVTGYFFYTLYYFFRLRSERNEWALSKGKKYSVRDYNPQPILNQGIPIKEMQVGYHRIFIEDTIPYLDTFGILTDDQLAEFVKRQHDLAKVIVAKACLKAQLDSLNN